MKKFLKYLSIFLVIGIGSLFVIPQARANFIGSVGEIIFSLRGVEEEAVNVFVPSPPEPEISLGNSESEALTAEQVLFEESITSLSAVGSCDDSVGEENRSFAQSIANGDFNFGTSGLENFNTDLNSIANQIDVDFTMTNDGLKVEIDRPEKDFVYKLLVNNVDVTIGNHVINNITNKLCNSAWQHFKHIEKDGGFKNSCSNGKFQSIVEKYQVERINQLKNNTSKYIGFNVYTKDKPSLHFDKKLNNPINLKDLV